MSAYLPYLGLPAGFLIWWLFIKPFQDRKWERRRREAGLPRRIPLPEDKEHGS